MRSAVIGLEVHVQVNTKSKLFCSCATDYIGAVPNTNVCPVCLGLPGALPVTNLMAVEAAILTSMAIGCTVNPRTRFHRKNYFYPDLPKAYQISQYDLPIGVDGKLELMCGHCVRIERLHMEEDAGKLVHGASDGRLAGSSYSLVDYNRGGVPLMEIVSRPDIRTAQEAKEYVIALRQIVRAIGVSDGDMESGSLRVDANISISAQDGSLGTKVEIKNLNSLRALERALVYEENRQRDTIAAGCEIVQETRHWDDGKGITQSSRGKEEAHDYRYFPDPDLPPIVVSEERIYEIRRLMPELPADTERRYLECGVVPEDAAVIVDRIDAVRFLDAAIKEGAVPKLAATVIRMDLLRHCWELKIELCGLAVKPADLAVLTRMVESGELSSSAVKSIMDRMITSKVSMKEAREMCGIGQKLAGDALRELIVSVLEQNGDVVAEIKSGADKKGNKMKFLQGQVMRAAKGQANSSEVTPIIEGLL